MKRGTSPFLVIQHTVLGEGRLDHAGVRYRVTPGQTMLVTMPHAHRYYLERGGNWEYFWFLLTGREAIRLARALTEVAGPILTLAPAQVDLLAGHCLSLLNDPTGDVGATSARAYGALSILHDAVFAQTGDGPVPLAPAIARVVGHIEGNLGSDLSIDRLAQVAGISRAHFVRRFTATLGHAPSDFVQARRMERIERLLLATEMTVGQIALLTGFADGNYLAKAFRRVRGLSPLEFRATRAEAV